MSLERGYIVVDDSGSVTANRQVDPVADISLSGGSGSLPAWWTVDDTPGSESVEFAGEVTIASGRDGTALMVDKDGDGDNAFLVGVADDRATVTLAGDMSVGQNGDDVPGAVALQAFGYSDASSFIAYDKDFNETLQVGNPSTGASAVGFFGTTPVAQQTGVAVTAEAIHAALVNYGLITA